MGRINVKTRFKSPPKQTERSKKLGEKFRLTHLNHGSERLISYRRAGIDPKADPNKANWSNLFFCHSRW